MLNNLIESIRKKATNEGILGYAVIGAIVIAAIGLIVALYIVLSQPKAIETAQVAPVDAITRNAATTESNKVAPEDSAYKLSEINIVRCEDSESQYESIKTQMFNLVKADTNEVCTVADGEINIDNLKETLDNYLATSKYKIMSIGLVNNQFYIQQDMTQPTKYTAQVGLVTLSDSFSADDWMKLTEAVYNSVYVEADSLFTAISTAGTKHFIYAYADKSEVLKNNTTQTDDTDNQVVMDTVDVGVSEGTVTNNNDIEVYSYTPSITTSDEILSSIG